MFNSYYVVSGLPEISWISPPRFDKQILNELQQLIDQYENKYKGIETTLNERATGQAFVEPLLGVLGWNIRDLDEVYPEFYVTGSGRVDYVLMINSMPVVYLKIRNSVKVSKAKDQAYPTKTKPWIMLGRKKPHGLCLPISKN